MITRTEYTKQLAELDEHVTRLGAMTVADVHATGIALTKGDEGARKGVLESHASCERLRRAIEDSCMGLMLLQQPLARDLRLVTAAFRAVPDLVRIDEMCSDIAILTGEFPDGASESVAPALGTLSELVARMVEKAMDAFEHCDIERANAVFASDDEIDDAYDAIRDAFVVMLRSKGPKDDVLPELLMIAKYYERMGDHAQSIADWALFRATGMYRGHMMGEAEIQ